MSSVTSDPLDVVRNALHAAGCDPRGGQRIQAKCPAHDDSNPSLSVTRGTAQPVVLTCHAGCPPDNVLAALRLEWSDLCEDDQDYERPVQRSIEATYGYTDESGTPLFDVVRFNPKDFRQRRPDGQWGISGVRRVLFRLPQVIDAVRVGAIVYVVEGEKDVLAVERAGQAATCNSGGAGKWRDEYNTALTGANVIVVADDDEPGHRHALDVARQLKPVAASVRMMLPVAGAKDVAQHLGRGLGLDDLRPFEAKPPPSADEPWPEPIALTWGKVPVFPAHRLPPWLNDYVCALAVALQVPVDMPAMLTLSVLAAAAGGRVVVEVRPGWIEPLNLYTAVAMAPGERKTPVFKRVIVPLEAAERLAVDKAKPEIIEAKVRHHTAKAKADKANDDAARASTEASDEATHFATQMALIAEAITVPTMPRLLADDATPEALASLLCEQGGRLAMFSDEGEVFSMIAGRYSNSGPNLGVYLKGHVGSPLRVDRKGRDPEFIEAPALTLGLTIQPAMLSTISGINGARGRGLLGRFLWSVPLSNMGRRESDTKPVPPIVEERYVDEVTVLVSTFAEWTDPAVLVFSPGADAAMLAFQRDLEPRLGAEGDLHHIQDWASKLAGAVARIAALLHLASNVRTGFKEPVSALLMDDAVEIAQRYLIPHALIAFDLMEANPAIDSAVAVLGWVSRRERFTRRDIYKAYQYRFKVVANVDPVLDLLSDCGYIREVPPEKATGRGRPPGSTYIVNPRTRS